MAIIAPFRGVRFNTAKITRVEDVVTPPYDVIDPNAEAAFLAKNPYNMIQLDLGKKSGSLQGEQRYQKARDLFRKWSAEEILIRDAQPGIYFYFIEYRHPSGVKLVRRGMVALVRLAEFSEGVVKPHEKTFAGVRTDRMKLMQACHAQFSQIFALYPDKGGEIIASLEPYRSDAPLLSVVDQDGCRHTIWHIGDPGALSETARFFRNRSLYIADGHHRYTTALEFRKTMEERKGALGDDSPYNFVMMYLCGMEDPGLSILPTHRLVRLPGEVAAADLKAKLEPGFAVHEIKGGSRETLIGEALAQLSDERWKQHDRHDSFLGFYHAREDRCFMLSLREGVMEKYFRGTIPDSLRDLDVVVLSDLLLDRCWGFGHESCERDGFIDYYSDPDDAIDIAIKEAGERKNHTPVLFLMNPTTVNQVQRVADEGLYMPHKSTYFYPKILTGLVINKLDADEKIRL